MKTTRLKTAILSSSLLLALATVGCGGGGGSVSSVPVSGAIGTTVARSIENGFFARQMGGRASSGTARAQLNRSTEVNETFFDEFYELYGRNTENGVDYFLDQALTQPAGRFTETITTTENGLIYSTTVEFTAGRFVGTAFTTSYTVNGDSITFSSSGQRPGTGTYSIEGSLVNGRVIFQSTNRDADGVDRFYNVTVEADGSSKVEYNTNQLFSYTLNYAADQSGSGTVTGNSALLPATLSWNSQGNGTLIFANGTILNFENFEFNSIP